jgi:hypothetical protein
VLQELAVLGQIALGRPDVSRRLDGEGRDAALGNPAVDRSGGDDDVVALAGLDHPVGRLEPDPAGGDVDALVAHGVAVELAGGLGRGVRHADVGVARQQSAPGDQVAAGRQILGAEVTGGERQVGDQRRGLGGRDRLGLDDRRGEMTVVEQGGVAGEALLAHQLLRVQPAVGPPELHMSLAGNLTHDAVVRHPLLPPLSDYRTLTSSI